MCQNSVTLRVVALLLFVSGCSGSSPSNDADQQAENNPASSLLDSTEILANLAFQGELPISSELTIDLSQMLQDADYSNPDLLSMSRDGSTILIRAQSNSVQVNSSGTSTYKDGYIRVDTESGEASWVLTEVGSTTVIHFDENNNAVMASSVGCMEVGFIDVANEAPTNFSSIIPADRCLEGAELSDDGNVVVFESFNKEFIVNDRFDFDTRFFAYTFSSSLLSELPNTSIVSEGNVLDPTAPLVVGSFPLPVVSNDGTHVLIKQWWGAIDDNIDSPNLIGSVVWNTLSNEWQTRGLAAGNREWCANNFDDCTQPFQYLLSADGSVQYSEIPNGETIDSNTYGYFYGSTVVRSLSTDASEIPIGLKNVVSLNVNQDGRFLSFYATEESGDLPTGLTLYDNNSGDFIPIDSILPQCVAESTSPNEPYCDNMPPNRMWSNYFSADGSQLLLTGIIFPFSTTTEFLLDLRDAALYTIPSKYTVFYDMVSGDGSVFAAPSLESENIFFIGKR